MRRAVVLGLARSGEAAAALLERHGVEVVRAGRELGNDDDVSLLDGADVLVKSPGVPRDNPLVRAARIPIWSEVELGYRLLPNPILGVTGTNGKTTTVEWLGAMFRAAGRDVAVAGNVGRALTGVDAQPGAWIVCELSSFQLEDVHEFRPRVAVLINLEPDHLDRHGTFESYRDAKLRVFENQTADDVAVVPRGFDAVGGGARRVEFAADDPLPAEPGLPGAHNRENAAAATAAARAAGVPDEAIAEALRSFPGVEHRLELVRELDGVRFVNDSQGTQPDAVIAALRAFDGPIVLIAGGRDKGVDLSDLGPVVAERAVAAVLIGESGPGLESRFHAAGLGRTERAATLEEAVRIADAIAREALAAGAQEPATVLLSPAAASFDMFVDYAARGRAFKEAVAGLAAARRDGRTR